MWLERLALCLALGGVTACDEGGGGGDAGSGSSGQGAAGTGTAGTGTAGTGTAGTGTAGTGSAGTGSAGTGTAGTGTAGTGTAGTGTAGTGGGEPARPPNPRTDIGSPDGVACLDWERTETSCSADQKCCPASIASMGETECAAPDGECTATCHAGTTNCAEVACDGPEDCPGQLCCLRLSSCSLEGAPCSAMYYPMRCEDRCELTETIQGQVACDDPRDCLVETSTCEQRGEFPFVKVCTQGL